MSVLMRIFPKSVKNGWNQASESPKRFGGFLLPIFRGK